MTIAAILRGKGHETIVVAPDDTVRQAVALLAERRIGAVPVVNGEEVLGVFSERDLIYCLKAGDTEVLNRPVREVMTAPAVTVSPEDPVMGALSLMTRRRIRHLPVVENGRMIGLVSIGDLVKYRIERVEADAAAMRDYIQQV
ncbi:MULTISPECIES: CBS domain-containing protein [unclassified Sphingomonas]|uniref:CBS domain-containing protein n=1 Tax=unclassified Sphingomonas TaxID=196159 RepID=UPI001D12A161|nr:MULTISPECIES: CBS domain-containing protein [unclassified Sphingomonas]MCC2981690.1 CBS domain-containing protein [Sphingomonas sp. IC4-52]MCD2317618.1 CBS domain-containing protein [Sphingomonas sp. IC-11]